MLTRFSLDGLVNKAGQHLVGAGELFTTGNVWYVDSVNGSNGNSGKDPQNAFAAIDTAVSAAVANNGDIIVLMPNHAENLANATTFQLDKAGISVIGIGEGRNRPVFSFTNASGSVNVDSADCSISNVVFLADVTGVTQGVDLDANDFSMQNCEFGYVDTGDDFIEIINTGTSDRIKILNNVFIAEILPSGAQTRAGLNLAGNEEVYIIGNVISGMFTSACIYDNSGGGFEADHYVIKGNTLYNATATVGIGLDLNSTARGILAENYIGQLNTTGGIDTAALLPLENYVTSAVDVSGILAP